MGRQDLDAPGTHWVAATVAARLPLALRVGALALFGAEAVFQAAVQEALAALALAGRLVADAVRLPALRPAGALSPGWRGRKQCRQGDKCANRRRTDPAWHGSVHTPDRHGTAPLRCSIVRLRS